MFISVPSFALCARLSNVDIRLPWYFRNSCPQFRGITVNVVPNIEDAVFPPCPLPCSGAIWPNLC